MPVESTPDECLSRMGAYQSLSDLNETDAEALAIHYQLVTDHTNYLLIHERKEEERAQELPELVQVRQMLPAGYGGLGSAAKIQNASSDQRLLMVNSSVGSIDHGNLKQHPAIARQKGISDVHYPRQVSSNSMGFKCLDIPTFLRRTADDLKLQDHEVAQSSGLENDAPISLVKWLLENNRGAWPHTIADLRKLGVMIEVITWLEIQQDDDRWARYSETDLVLAFLVALLHHPTFARRQRRGGLLDGFMARIRGLNPNKPAAIEFMKHVEHELKDLQFDSWGKSITEIFDCMV